MSNNVRVIDEEKHKYLFEEIRKESVQILYNSHITSAEFFRRTLNHAWWIYESKYGKPVPKTELVLLVGSITSYQWKRRKAIRLSSPEFRKKGTEWLIKISKARCAAAHHLHTEGYSVEEIANATGVKEKTIRKYLRTKPDSKIKSDINTALSDAVRYRKPISNGDGKDVSVLISDSIWIHPGWWKSRCYAMLPSASVEYLDYIDSTSTNIVANIKKMTGDRLVFLYTGHGDIGYAALNDGNGEKVAWDDIFTVLRDKKKPVAVVIDSCHSGSAVDSFKKTFKGFSENAVLIVSSGKEELAYNNVLSNYLLKYGTLPSVLGRKGRRHHPEVWVYDASTQEFREIRLVSRGKNKRMIPLFSDKIFNLEE